MPTKIEVSDMYTSVLTTYERIMAIERSQTEKERDNQQWKNIMYSLLSLMLSTDADDAFLVGPNDSPGMQLILRQKMAEYDQMLERYGSIFTKKGVKIRSHS